MSSDQTFVIVGASLAGAKAAETLREEGFDGRVLLLGAEPERPYERPPLSKDYLRGDTKEKPYVHEESFYAEKEIELRTSSTVTAIHPSSAEVELEGGERARFDRLLLTTGAEPRRLPVQGAELDGVLYLRSVEDSDSIRKRIERGGKLVTIGVGWIGAEVAASAKQKGCDVTIVEMASVPLERVLGLEVGAIYRDIHTDQGVEFLANTGLEAFEGNGKVEAVRTDDGRRIEADIVVVGVGVAPRTELAEAAGLPVDNGVVVNELLETEASGIFAAGDVANAIHPLFGERIRVEHWANALHQGPAAASNMVGRNAPYDKVPYFFSDQYDVGMEYAGYATSSDEVVFRGDPASREFIAFWLQGDRVVAGMNVNVWEVTDQIQELIRSRQDVDRGRLRDPDVPLEEVTGGPTGVGRGLKQVLADGFNYPRRLIQGRLAKGDEAPLSSVGPGEGKVLEHGGEKVAISRADDGELRALSPVCTHLGCIVEWGGDHWDCHCHGSRFAPDGEVIRGPAKKPLERKKVTDAEV
jgi:3-phenylpropionate/trans-cinnamate dioxygenase ferredoxin reductase component